MEVASRTVVGSQNSTVQQVGHDERRLIGQRRIPQQTDDRRSSTVRAGRSLPAPR